MMTGRERLLRSIYEKKRLSLALYVYSTAFSTAVALLFIGYIGFLAFEWEYLEILKLVITAGVPFFLVGLVRRIIGAKRPFEVYDFYTESPKRGAFGIGRERSASASFPSRHAYSAFVVSVSIVFVSVPVGAVLLILSVLMCVARVLLGIHFVRDVVAGALIGSAAAVLGEFLIRF